METGAVDAVPQVLTAMTDFEVDAVLAQMKSQKLGTDQRLVAAQALEGRTLTCRQGGALLGVVQLGIMQRMLAFEVLKGRLSDLPDGLPDLLGHLSGRILIDVGNEFGGASFDHNLYTSRSTASTSSRSCHSGDGATSPWAATTPRQAAVRDAKSSCPVLLPKQSDWVESVDRLRAHVVSGDVSDTLYEDVRSVFDALGLGQLPPRREPREGGGASGRAGGRAAPGLPPVQLAGLAGAGGGGAAAAPLPPLLPPPSAPPESPTPLPGARGPSEPGPSGEASGGSTPRSTLSEESV